jgi:hypothetical protein
MEIEEKKSYMYRRIWRQNNTQQQQEPGSLSKVALHALDFARKRKAKSLTAIRLPPIRDLETLLNHDALLCSIMQWSLDTTVDALFERNPLSA